MIIYCPSCNKKYDVNSSVVGAIGSCSSCRRKFKITSNMAKNSDVAAVENQDEYKKCPMCGEKILKEAKICRFCRTELEENDVVKKAIDSLLVFLIFSFALLVGIICALFWQHH